MLQITYRDELNYAFEAHGDQKRKYTGQPYITHPMAVAQILIGIEAPRHVVMAGLFHDIIEDTSVDYRILCDQWGSDVADLVMQVTNVSKPEDGDRAVRKRIDARHISSASYWGQTIKLADLIDNTRTIVKYDKKFAVNYLLEKAELLVLMHNCNHTLKQYALDVLELSNEILRVGHGS